MDSETRKGELHGRTRREKRREVGQGQAQGGSVESARRVDHLGIEG